MIKPRIPRDEGERQAALDQAAVLDTPPEERFDRYTRLAKRLFAVPTALVSLVDQNRQWFKSRQGLDATETPRDIAFCAHAINEPERVLVVENATEDERFHDNPLVTGDPQIRFYAGCPITTPNGHAIGTLCIIDGEPRTFTAEDEESLQDIGAMVSAELATLRLATIDDLTGLSNRRAFRMMADQALAMCRRTGKQASLLMIDLDGFKQINDQLGHACGDRALKDFARVMFATFRESDVLARFGGDEFCVLLTETDFDAAWNVVERFRAALGELNDRPGRDYTLQFSAGVVEFDPGSHEHTSDLLDAADDRMYKRKKSKASQPKAVSA